MNIGFVKIDSNPLADSLQHGFIELGHTIRVNVKKKTDLDYVLIFNVVNHHIYNYNWNLLDHIKHNKNIFLPQYGRQRNRDLVIRQQQIIFME